MKIRTLENLVDFIDTESRWRNRELLTIRQLLHNARKHQQTVLKQSLVLAYYAHWEGFVKFSSEAYLEYVSRRKILHRNLAFNFVAVSMRSDLESFLEINKATIVSKTVTKFVGLRDSASSKFTWKGELNMRNNLNSDCLEQISGLLGLDVTEYKTHFKFIDSVLLKKRNEIAHGEKCYIDHTTIEEIQEKMPELSGKWKNDILNAATRKSYLRSNN